MTHDPHDFYASYRPVGQFPGVPLTDEKLLLTRLFKTVGGVAMPLL